MKKGVSKKSENSFEKVFLAVKVLVSVIFGFLPSFLFIAFFIQYGSVFSNYIKFLSDFNSSLGAWISAIVISLFVYFILGFIKREKKLKGGINKKVIIILALLFAVIFVLISIQLYLYVNFTLRNDILVQLSADKENIFFTDNSREDITFKIDLIMNPFCSAQCEYEFFDISSGKEIESGSFSITTILSQSKTYTINNEKLIEGSQELKRFEVTCKSERTLLCYTREEESKRAILVTVNYELSEDEKIFKNDSRNNITKLEEISYFSKGNLNELQRNINSINNSFSTENFSMQAGNLSILSGELKVSLDNVKKLWANQSFDLLKDELPEVKEKIENLENESEELRLNIISDISLYNALTENFSTSKKILEEIANNTKTDLICGELNKIIPGYNKAFSDFKDVFSLQNKKLIADEISEQINEFYEKYQTFYGETVCLLAENVTSEDLMKIDITLITPPPVTFSLREPDSVCCLSGKCGKCCGEECSTENYPIIFLHGQSINEAISVGYSLDTFSKIKEKMISTGYIDAGAIILGTGTGQGLWGKVNSTLIMTGSYFFDTYKTETGESVFSSNKEGIDTYAIRLKNLVELVKSRTNKDKVIIATHSMGGVVARRYVQIFGGNSVEKMILVTSPNHGIDDKIRDYCAVIGPEVSCSELDKNSIFMNQLNNARTEKIPTYNIIGTGCNMGDETGDGVIKSSSQYLESAVNYYFSGTCNELNFEFFHEYIIYPDKYPEVYNKIYEILKNSEF